MRLQEKLLYSIAKNWPSPVKQKQEKLGDDVNSDDYHLKYALHNQYLLKVKSGITFDFYDKSILEIGCGHGGISCYLAVNGAKSVVGVDINDRNLKIAKKFKDTFRFNLTGKENLPVEFYKMNAEKLKFKNGNFDIVIADNVFEHLVNPELVLAEIYRVLADGGILIIPAFSSWWSMYALHLKHGLKVPWANLFFSEKTIVNVLYQLALDNSNIFNMYPGLINKPDKVRDVRKHRDLNYITYKKFKKMSLKQGFKIELFSAIAPKKIRLINRLLKKIPLINNSILVDIFSGHASAICKK